MTDLHAGLDILYLRGGPKCRGRGGVTAPNCPETPASSQQVNETREALEAATDGSRPDPRFTLRDLDAAAATALRLRFALGEFDAVEDNPYARPQPSAVIDGAAHRKIAREATAASVVVSAAAAFAFAMRLLEAPGAAAQLLKNEKELLPLHKSANVAAVGPWVQPELQPSMGPRPGQPGNAYVHSYAGGSSAMSTFFEGIAAALGRAPAFAQGCETNQTLADDPSGLFEEAKRVAAAADVTILAVGLTASVRDKAGVGHEQEMIDRLSLELPEVQTQLIEAVRSVAKKVVLVIVSGSAVPFNESNADAALYAMYGGEEAGNGLADVLFGETAPTGRLPFTVFTSLEQMKPMGDYDLTTQPGRTHLYYDDASVAAHGTPQFWFGYGLGFSSFGYSNLTLALSGKCGVTAVATVTNAGKVASREVSQLYLGRPKPPAAVPMAAWPLKGYERTELLAPGASATVRFELTRHDLSTVHSDGTRQVTPGAYTVKVGGGNPRDPRAPAAPVAGSVTLSGSGCANANIS